jgi:phage tail-like protein
VADPATGLRFDVTIDGVDIGSFTGCEGLGAEYEIFEYQEGGQNAFVHRLPGRLKYSPVRLTRPVDESSGRLAAWFSGFQQPARRCTASITAFDGAGNRIAQWNLVELYPSRWSGPAFTADGNAVAKETLELAHNGFLAAPGRPA